MKYKMDSDNRQIFFSNVKGKNLTLSAITDRLIRMTYHNKEDKVSSSCSSYAIENPPALSGHFTIEEHGNVVLRTNDVNIFLNPSGNLRMEDTKGNLLWEDYQGVIPDYNSYSKEDLELMAQEGHVVPVQGESRSHTLRKCLFGGEHVYGLGDKTGVLDKMGYDYMMWNSDLPDPHVENPSFKALYKSITFFIVHRELGAKTDSHTLETGLESQNPSHNSKDESSLYYGVFVDNPHKTFFDFGFENRNYYSISCTEGDLDCYIFYGENMAEIVTAYTELVGRAPLPQLWTLGYHQSRWGYSSAQEIRELANSFVKNNIPIDVIHMDIDYMDNYKVFTKDDDRFPDLPGLAKDLSEMGIKLVTIIDPGVKVEKGYFMYEVGVRDGHFALTKEGDIYENVVWPGDSVYPDFTSEKTRKWWGEQSIFQVENGIRGIWNDMNEPASFRGPLPDDVVFPGDDQTSVLYHKDVHNVYGHLMSKATYEGLKKTDGRRPFVITRACYAGTAKYATAWTGDNQSLWAHLKMSIPQLLNLGLSGMPLVGTDIGGFGSNTTPELLTRWIEASAFAPLFRNHSAKYSKHQEPWQFDENTMNIYRKYVKLHYKFLPYLYDLCYQQTQTGLPILRPLMMHYGEDKNTWQCNDQYLVGEHMLVSPVTDQGALMKMVYLPQGEWVDYWTEEIIEGGRYILREAPIDLCPIYIRAGHMLPTCPDSDHVPESGWDTLIMSVYLDSQGLVSPYIHYQDNGCDFAYENGEYNLYKFSKICETSSPSNDTNPADYTMSLLHDGYMKYKEIQFQEIQ